MRNIQTNGFPLSTHHFLDDFGGPLFQEPPFDLHWECGSRQTCLPLVTASVVAAEANPVPQPDSKHITM